MKPKNDGREATFYRRLFSLALPMAARNLLNALVSASDALMLGFLDQDSLSAVSLGALAAFVFKWPVTVVYLLLNLDEFTRMPVEWHHYRRYRWVRNLTGETEGEAS